MSEEKTPAAETPAESAEVSTPPQTAAPAIRTPPREDRFRWWIKLVLPPVLFLAAGIVLMVALGTAQKLGWISAGGGGGQQHASTGGENVRYICPMMCTPPQTEPGRCPVCAMELVPASSGGGNTDELSIQVDPAARRVANIRTAAVKAVPLTRKIRAIGELCYDEGTLKTLAAYVDGRLDRLYADYTGVVVEKGDHLALVYSPELYSSQVELLVAKRARQQNRSRLPSATYSGHDLYDSSRERLVEFGMTPSQIECLEEDDKASSRLHLCAPISGTVIEKLAVEGQYVKTGQPIYRLADLSTVWLMLELFPEDAASIRYGQQVEAQVQSLPGRKFTGRIAFIDPTVNRDTRTVGVRVVMRNDEGLLRIGDYAKATIAVNLGDTGDRLAQVYDPELADKWISPRHPHVVESSAGNCRVCGVSLVPAARFGFASEPTNCGNALVVPRNAVLMAGQSSVVYVETEPGRFEIRSVVLGPSSGEEISILEGVKEGEQVACSGNFLIDSQMQLAGNPSLIDPTKAKPTTEQDQIAPGGNEDPKIAAAIAKLPPEDRALAKKQRICPVADFALGSMGTPIKVDVNGTPVFICCGGCRESLLEEPDKYLGEARGTPATEDSPKDVSQANAPQMDIPPIGAMQMLEPQTELPQMQTPGANGDEAVAIAKALTTLSSADRSLAERQRVCPVTDMPLGSMGTPIKVSVNGRLVFICCEGCRERLLAEPVKYLAKLPQEAVR